jgi:FkbM family methyltransferase
LLSESEIEKHKSGLWYRPGTLDDLVIREAKGYVEHMPPNDEDVVLDLGANIGAATCAFTRAGAAKVIAVEPEPGNVEVLRRNVADLDPAPVVFHAAVVSSSYEDETIPLLVSPGKNQGAHSTLSSDRSRRDTIDVTALSLEYLLDEFKPTLLKIDIEGAEYQIATELADLPKHVRAITIEHHTRGVQHLELADRIEGQGFGSVWESSKLGSTRTRFCVRVYVRGVAPRFTNELVRDSLSADRERDIRADMTVTHKKYGRGRVIEVDYEYAVVEFEILRARVSTRSLTIEETDR